MRHRAGRRAAHYRGSLELRGHGGGVTAVNALGLDDYVQGVVPGEMPSNWPPEALKAQAVAARTYALDHRRRRHGVRPVPDTRSQVYSGMDAEGAHQRGGRRDRDQVVTYNGQWSSPTSSPPRAARPRRAELFYGALPEPYLKSGRGPLRQDRAAPPLEVRPLLARSDRRSSAASAAARSARCGSQRGFSPRIVSADVVCSRGSRARRGAGAALAASAPTTPGCRLVRVDSNGSRRPPKVLGRTLGQAAVPARRVRARGAGAEGGLARGGRAPLGRPLAPRRARPRRHAAAATTCACRRRHVPRSRERRHRPGHPRSIDSGGHGRHRDTRPGTQLRRRRGRGAASTWTWRAARSTASSAPTAPARPRRCGCW